METFLGESKTPRNKSRWLLEPFQESQACEGKAFAKHAYFLW
jgi:hypothetical protein